MSSSDRGHFAVRVRASHPRIRSRKILIPKKTADFGPSTLAFVRLTNHAKHVSSLLVAHFDKIMHFRCFTCEKYQSITDLQLPSQYGPFHFPLYVCLFLSAPCHTYPADLAKLRSNLIFNFNRNLKCAPSPRASNCGSGTKEGEARRRRRSSTL